MHFCINQKDRLWRTLMRLKKMVVGMLAFAMAFAMIPAQKVSADPQPYSDETYTTPEAFVKAVRAALKQHTVTEYSFKVSDEVVEWYNSAESVPGEYVNSAEVPPEAWEAYYANGCNGLYLYDAYRDKIFDFYSDQLGSAEDEGDYLFGQMFMAYDGEMNYDNTFVLSRSGQSQYSDQANLITAAQEQAATERINALFAPGGELNPYINASDAVKVIASLDWIRDHVGYIGTTEYYWHSAYAAIVDGRATCEGQSYLLYRLLRKFGIANRVIGNYDTSGGAIAAHSFNPVKIGGTWYYCDSTSHVILQGSNSYNAGTIQDFFSEPRMKQNILNNISASDYDLSAAYAEMNRIKSGEYTPAPKPVKNAEKIKAFASRMYTVVLSRDAETNGLEYWSEKLMTDEKSCADVVAGFICSEEFTNHHYSNEQIVVIMYKTMLDRDPDPDGKAYWISKLDKGCTPVYIINGFSGSTEFNNICNNYGMVPGTVAATNQRDVNENVTAFAARCYTKILSRDFEDKGLEYWCEQINSKTQAPVAAAKGFVNSQEFINKNYNDRQYLEILYRAFFDREYDEQGMNYWLAKLSNGMTREEVLNGFSGSVEFSGVVASFGL